MNSVIGEKRPAFSPSTHSNGRGCSARGGSLRHDALHQFEWVRSIGGIDPSEWSACFKINDISNSYDLALALERSQFDQTAFHYLIGKTHQGEISCIIPCFLYSTPIDILAPPPIQRATGLVRRFFGSFLVVRTLIVGSPIAICGDSLGLVRYSSSARPALLRRIKIELVRKARQLCAHLVAIKELSEEDRTVYADALAPEFYIVPSMPVAFLTLQTGEGNSYIKRMRRHYRAVFKKRRLLFDDGGLQWKEYKDLSGESDTLYRLYREVFERSDAQFVGLTPDFFRQISQRLGDRCTAHLALKGDECVGFALVLSNDEMIFPIYIGFRYELRDEHALYYNILYRCIEVAEERGVKEVLFGQTATDSKALIGCSFRALHLAVCPISPFAGLVIRSFRSSLFPEDQPIARRVFKDTTAEQQPGA